jgi:hypothetical protein
MDQGVPTKIQHRPRGRPCTHTYPASLLGYLRTRYVPALTAATSLDLHHHTSTIHDQPSWALTPLLPHPMLLELPHDSPAARNGMVPLPIACSAISAFSIYQALCMLHRLSVSSVPV